MEENKEKTGYKHTLNLPRTDFSMKANLQQREPETLKAWEAEDIYRRILDARKDSPKTFILHDGPPYANGNIHMGHVLNKILKDICVKYFAMKGYRAPYVPGWDCHGLPVEHQLFKELGMTKHEIGQLEFRKKAYKYAMRYVKIQVEEFKRLGIFGDWNDPYLTLSKNYEADIIGSLADLCEKGYIYKDLKPVNWCSKCETALAEAEVEYEDKVSPSIYVKFKTSPADGKKETFFVIWTTTPWTLLANVAVALHPDFIYSFVDTGREILIMVSDLVETIMKRLGIKEYTVLHNKKGSVIEKEFRKARHPFIDRDSVVVTAGYVTKDDGTGCVHTAPGHGQEDYITGKKYGLPIVMPVKNNGKFSDDTGEFAGLGVIEANSAIMEKMKKLGVLMAAGEVKHSYPHCWRCKEPIIFRATEQWFMSVDHMSLRARMDKAIKEDVEWIPRAGEERIGAMLRTRPDWCLSRQRYWGVPIPALECVSCGEAFTDASMIRNIAKLARDRGADVWFELPVERIVPEGKVCAKCGGAEFKKENDILDVWFDSGVSHRAVIEARKELTFPADLYLEGSDQHRGWFQAALITSMAMNGRPPYKKVLTHGFVVDGDGKKMSKSVGNVISPQEVMKKYGADILRLWVSSSDYEGDIKISPEILERLADGYRKIRNTFRYLLSNLYDFEPSKDAVPLSELSETDRWMLSRLASLVEEVDGYYAAWEFHKVYRAVYNFCVYEISAFYLDVIKDVLYVMAPSSRERRSAQTVVFRLLHVLVRMLAPVLSFTAEEVWSAVSFKGKEKSVHLSAWPMTGDKEISSWKNSELDRKFNDILKIRDGVMKILEVKREKGLIGSSLEASIGLYSEDRSLAELIKEKTGLLPSLFKVSQVFYIDSASDELEDIAGLPIKARVSPADGVKCQRCWNFSVTVGKSKNAPDLCERCYNVVSGKEIA